MDTPQATADSEKTPPARAGKNGAVLGLQLNGPESGGMGLGLSQVRELQQQQQQISSTHRHSLMPMAEPPAPFG